MPNQYFEHTPVTRHSRARSPDFNAQLAGIEQGFDRLPDRAKMNEGRVTYVEGAGVANVYTGTLTPPPTAYVAGMHVAVRLPAVNTGPSTLNLNGLGARAIKLASGSNPLSGDLPASIVEFRYDGTNFIVTSPTRSLNGFPDESNVRITGGTVQGVTLVGNQLIRNGGLLMEGVTGGYQGAGTANLAGLYIGGKHLAYEEGEWTPIIFGQTTAGAGTYVAPTHGRFTRKGRAVQFSAEAQWTAHTGTGNMRMGGLPLVCERNVAVAGYIHNISLSAGSTFQAFILSNSNTIVLRQVPTGGGAATEIPMDTAGQILIAGEYSIF